VTEAGMTELAASGKAALSTGLKTQMYKCTLQVNAYYHISLLFSHVEFTYVVSMLCQLYVIHIYLRIMLDS